MRSKRRVVIEKRTLCHAEVSRWNLTKRIFESHRSNKLRQRLGIYAMQ